MNDQFAAAWRLLPDYLSQHIVLSASALSLGLLISMPLMILALRNARLRWVVIAVASLIQTIPSLALGDDHNLPVVNIMAQRTTAAADDEADEGEESAE